MAIKDGDLLLKGEWFLDAIEDGEDLDDLILGLREAIKVIILDEDREKLDNVSANRFASLILGNAGRMGDAATKQKIGSKKGADKKRLPLDHPEITIIWAMWMEGYTWKEIQDKLTCITNKKTGIYTKPGYLYIHKSGYLAEKGYEDLTPETMCEGNPRDIILESSFLSAQDKEEYLERIGEIQSKIQTESDLIQTEKNTENVGDKTKQTLNQTEKNKVSLNSDLIQSESQTENNKILTEKSPKGFVF